MTTTAPPPIREGLLEQVSRCLDDRFDAPTVIRRAYRSAYCTSHTIFDLEVEVDGQQRQLVLKDLSSSALLPEARGKRPEAVADPGREVAVYSSILAGHDVGTAECFGAKSDPLSGEHWLLLEKVAGVELYQVGEVETWAHAAARIAMLHDRLADVAENPPSELPSHNAAYYSVWWRRALAFTEGAAASRRRAMQWLADRHPAVTEEIADMPVTIVHGDCSASNVLVDGADGRVCPVDWEMAAVGPGLGDLAALIAGWPEADAAQMSDAYHRALGPDRPDPHVFRTALDRCRLQLHVQWLGWSPDWVPPEDHRQDSLAEAVALAERLGL